MSLSKQLRRKTTNWPQKVRRKLNVARKDIAQRLSSKREETKVLMIIGCQRSGTTMLTYAFEKDDDIKVYGELDTRIFVPETNYRIRDLNYVNNIIKRSPYPFVVLKPLVESQNTPDLLTTFPEAKAIWMFRHFKDVARSNLKRFGVRNGITNLKPIVQNETSNWRADKVPADVKDLVLTHFSDDMAPHDAAALFWYVRNRIFFDLALYEREDIIMCQYRDIVQNPLAVTRAIYSFIDAPFPGDHIVEDVHASSIGRGSEIELSPEIEVLCEEMFDRLKIAYAGTPIEKIVNQEAVQAGG